VNKKDHKTDLEYYESCVKAIHEHSPVAKVFCLIHKSDLLEADKKNEVLFIFSCFNNLKFAFLRILMMKYSILDIFKTTK